MSSAPLEDVLRQHGGRLEGGLREGGRQLIIFPPPHHIDVHSRIWMIRQKLELLGYHVRVDASVRPPNIGLDIWPAKKET